MRWCMVFVFVQLYVYVVSAMVCVYVCVLVRVTACFCVSGWVVQVDDVCVCCVWGNGVWFGAYVWCCGAYVNIYYMYIYTSYELVFIIDVLQT